MYRYLFVALVVLVLLTGSALAAGKVLFIGSGAPIAGDIPLVQHLEEWGFEVEPHGHLENPPGKPIEGDFDLVFVAESTSSVNVLGAYKDSTIPVVSAETYIFDDMGFAPDGTFTDVVGRRLTIVKNDHPITEGFPETVDPYTGNAVLMSCSAFGGDVEILAVREDMPDFAAIAVYEKGAKTMTGTTKARYVSIFVHSTGVALLNDDGWELVKRSVFYALGSLGQAVEAEGKLASTWGTIKSARQ